MEYGDNRVNESWMVVGSGVCVACLFCPLASPLPSESMINQVIR